MTIQKIILTKEKILLPINIIYISSKLEIDRSEIGDNEKERFEYNLHALARKNKNVKEMLIELINNGYFLVEHRNGKSIFEKFTNAEQFQHNLMDKKIKIFNDLFYTLEEPKMKTTISKLLIVFSSVADFSLNASILRRNFFTNFKSIGKYIPDNAYILRISDIGGVVGSFYLNNNFSNKVEKNIQELIRFILDEKKILKNDVVLYGVSKGGTGALYHGILGKYKTVAVDPIISDEYHEKRYNDCHFTNGTFPVTKQEKFYKLMKNSNISSNINIIYSENSPIYGQINSIIRDNDRKEKINYINVCHPKIKDHPDVGPNTIGILTCLLTNLYYEFGQIKSKNLKFETLKVVTNNNIFSELKEKLKKLKKR